MLTPQHDGRRAEKLAERYREELRSLANAALENAPGSHRDDAQQHATLTFRRTL